MKFFKRLLLIFFLLSGILLIVVGIVYKMETQLDFPQIDNRSIAEQERENPGNDFYVLGANWLKKNDYGIWEMYLEGNAFERGIAHGKLARELVQDQERYFVEQIKELVPSDFYLRFLKYFVRWFNRDIDEYIPEEYKKEIYGVSFSASDDYGFIGNNYERILNYHAAHDIGHALQNLALVGCTSFSTWDDNSKKGDLFIGRNFDFYAGENFAKDKILLFINPDKGYKLATVSWGGFIGVVSGMNEKGLSVTMNAAKSEIPGGAATPISIIGREILQYAANIEEAFQIAQKRRSFVSESIMIGSETDGKTALIEITPDTTVLFLPQASNSKMLCSNHFRSEYFSGLELHKRDRERSASAYRFERLKELMQHYDTLDAEKYAAILRDRKGLGNEDIGTGNEKALNQLIAHHAVIFNLTKKIFWLSANPFQLGAFIPYQLDEVFDKYPGLKMDSAIYNRDLIIPADTFLQHPEYDRFLTYKSLLKKIKKAIANKTQLNDKLLGDFEAANPQMYLTHWVLGNYYAIQENCNKAEQHYQKALELEIPNKGEAEQIEKDRLNCS
ncbi:MAG: C45 family peptidase [Chitinophagales bacterium]